MVYNKKFVQENMGKTVDFCNFIIIRPKNNYRLNSAIIILKDPTSPVIIDCGTPIDPGNMKLKQAFSQSQIDLNKIKYIFLTHAHPDHVTNLSYLQKLCPNSKTVTHIKEYDEMKNPNRMVRHWVRAVDLIGKKPFTKAIYKSASIPIVMGLYRTVHLVPKINYTISPALQQDFSSIKEFKSGDLRLKFLPTPGHSAGHFSILDNHKNLFLGDFLPFTPWINLSTRSLDEMILSIQQIIKLNSTQVKYAIRSHGDVRINNPLYWEITPWEEEREKFKIFLNTINESLEKIPKLLSNNPDGLNFHDIANILIPHYGKYSRFTKFFVPPSSTWIGAYLLKLEQEKKIKTFYKRSKRFWK